MNRRVFLRTTGSIAGVGIISGGLAIRHSYAVDHLAREMVNETLPFVEELWQSELNSIPEIAREEVRQFFHLRCLNVEHFLQTLTSTSLQFELANVRKESEREEIVMREFCQHVVSAEDIVQHLTELASRLGKSLDQSWATSCQQISQKWTNQHGLNNATDPELLALRTHEKMLKHLRSSARNLRGSHELALEESFTEVGRAALLLIPLKRISKSSVKVALPCYFVDAIRPYCPYFNRLSALRNQNALEQISKKLSELSNQIGDECKRVMLEKVNHLHTVRQLALMEIARNLAKQYIPYV